VGGKAWRVRGGVSGRGVGAGWIERKGEFMKVAVVVAMAMAMEMMMKLCT